MQFPFSDLMLTSFTTHLHIDYIREDIKLPGTILLDTCKSCSCSHKLHLVILIIAYCINYMCYDR
jgi:hypothetical protein